MVVTFNRNPTPANAGPDRTDLSTCGLTSVILAANTPAIGTGTWSIISGSGGTITTPSSPTSNFSGTAGTTYTLRWTITNSPCTQSTDDVVITFNRYSVINPMTRTVCSASSFTATPANGTNGTVIAGTTYTWSAPSGSGFTGGAASTGTPTSISGTLTNTTNAAVTATYTVTPTTGVCVGTPFTLTVTVNPKPAINPMTASTCSGVAFSVTPANTTNGTVPSGTTYTWSAPSGSGFTGGAASVGNPTSIGGTLTNTTSGPVTATYTVTPTSGTCGGSSFALTVTVNALPTITLPSSSVSVYYSASSQMANLAYSATTQTPTTYSIVWNGSPANSFAAITDAAFPASPIVITVPAATAANTYTGQLTVKNGNGCISSSSAITVIVLPSTDLAVTKTVSDSAPVVGTNVTFTLTATNNGPSAATSVIVTDLLPSGYQYVSDDSSSTSTTYVSGTGVWTIGNLANGASVVLHIVAKVL